MRGRKGREGGRNGMKKGRKAKEKGSDRLNKEKIVIHLRNG